MAPASIASVPITTELFAGQLPVMMLKTWLDRDEDGNRAVPVLLGNLRFRVGDIVGLKIGKQTGREMFKLECEYGDGAVKWVSADDGARLTTGDLSRVTGLSLASCTLQGGKFWVKRCGLADVKTSGNSRVSQNE